MAWREMFIHDTMQLGICRRPCLHARKVYIRAPCYMAWQGLGRAWLSSVQSEVVSDTYMRELIAL